MDDDDEVVNFAHDHVDKTVAELIGSRNYKQALKTLDKKNKKKSSLNNHIVKAAILCRSGDLKESNVTLSEVLSNHPPPYAPDVCQLLYITLCSVKYGGIAVKDKVVEDIWMKTIAAERQEDKAQLAKDWMYLAIQHRHWQYVVKASQLLSTLSIVKPEEALKLWRLQICARYMHHLTSSSGSELDRRLALSTLQKAAKDTPEPSESPPAPGKWVATDKLLKLLAEVYQREGQAAQLLDLLRDSRFATIVEDNNEFLCLTASLWANCPPEVRLKGTSWTRAVLEAASGDGGRWLRDDWQIWNVLVLATAYETRTISDQDPTENSSVEALSTLVEKLSPPSPMNRASTLAVLDATLDLSHQNQSGLMALPQHSALAACVAFFQIHNQSDFVASDLRPRLLLISNSDRKSFSQQVNDQIGTMKNAALNSEAGDLHVKWLRSAINALAIDRINLDEAALSSETGQKTEEQAALWDYTSSCLAIYRITKELDERQRLSLTNAANMTLDNIAWALTRLASLMNDPSLAHLSSLVDLLHADAGPTDEWRIKTIHNIHQRGAPTAAWPHYSKLGVRHTSVETAAPLMFCRISSTLACSAPDFDVYNELGRSTKFYKNMLSMVPQFQEMALSHENYSQCIGLEREPQSETLKDISVNGSFVDVELTRPPFSMQDLLHEVEASPVRWILGLERRRIARIRNMAYDNDDIFHEPSLLPGTLSKKTREIWKYACGEVSESYVHFLAFLDDLAELVRRGAGDEPLYLARLKTHKPYLTPNPSQTICMRICDMLLVVAEAVGRLDESMTANALRALETYLTSLVENELLGVEPLAYLRGPLPGHDCSHSYILEAVSQTRIFCKNIAKRLKERSVSTEADAVDKAAAQITQSIRAQTQSRLDAMKALQKADDLVEKVIGPCAGAEIRANVLDLVGHVGHERAHEYFKALVDGSVLTLESLFKLQAE